MKDEENKNSKNSGLLENYNYNHVQEHNDRVAKELKESMERREKADNAKVPVWVMIGIALCAVFCPALLIVFIVVCVFFVVVTK